MFVGYPAELKPEQWEKNKGIIAKFAGETGIGKALTELKKLYDEADQTKLTAQGYGKPRAVSDFDVMLESAKKYYAEKMVPLRDKARDVSKLAASVQVKFKSSKLIPKSSAEYVGKVAGAADMMALGLKSLDAELKTFGDAKARFTQNIDEARKNAKTHVLALEEAVKKCLAVGSPTGKDWLALVKQKNRSVGNSLGNVPEYKEKFWKVWQPLDGLQISDSETDTEKVKQACKKLLAEIPAVKSYLG